MEEPVLLSSDGCQYGKAGAVLLGGQYDEVGVRYMI
jgi:hypothetical protein